MPKYPNPREFRIDSLKYFYCIMYIPIKLDSDTSCKYQNPKPGLEVLTLDRSGEKFGFETVSSEKRGKIVVSRKFQGLYDLIKAGKFEEVLSQEDWNKLYNSMIVRVQILPEGETTFMYAETCQVPLDSYYTWYNKDEFKKWCSELPSIKNSPIIRFEEEFFAKKIEEAKEINNG